MSYTNLYGQPQGDATSVTSKLREILIAEIFAINGYYEHIANSNMRDVNEVLHHIMEEEQEHYDIIVNLLRKYDPLQYKMYLEVKKENMGFRSPVQKYVPDYDQQLILNNIRHDLKGEYEAVILYEEIIANTTNREIIDAVTDITNDEKEHAEELTRLLLKYNVGINKA
ncbi:MAG: rubrerythrin [Clostridiales bacterium GWE2_32_10]|nr:MAG: rubrerythrin [Clostridiales bacterium GWE2_32_10]HBY19656.1 rubrerythrin [Clostridiales bacterium]